MISPLFGFPLTSTLFQVWTCCIAHGTTMLAHSSHKHFLYGLPEEGNKKGETTG